MTITITLHSDEATRKDFRIAMKNTMGEDEIYSVVQYTFNGRWESSVAVQKDGKRGKFWSELNPVKHRHQVARVLAILAENK